MAKVSLLRFSDGGRRLIYNIDAAVGPGALNRRDDVLLVQYFLREVFKGAPDFQNEPFSQVVAVDGIAGKQTFAAILHFQRVGKKKSANIATDGRVDPPVGEQVKGSISGTNYTIIFMNRGYRSARPGDWPRVSQAADCPGELRPLLSEPEFVS